jgi:LmbE family N-acetylglucosaminyl deacetylase
VDISETVEVKLQAVRCHESQGLTAPQIQERIRNRAAEVGRARGYLFAEAFKKLAM